MNKQSVTNATFNMAATLAITGGVAFLSSNAVAGVVLALGGLALFLCKEYLKDLKK